MKVSLLVRFFKDEQHAVNFLNNGEIYMNSLLCFKKYEETEENNIADPFEATRTLRQPSSISNIKVSGGPFSFEIKPEDLAGPLVFGSTEYDFCKVYCFSILEMDAGNTYDRVIKIRASNLFEFDRVDFGDTCVVIVQPKEFIDRVRRSKGHNNLAGKRVSYYEFNSHDGDIENPVFSKRSEFSHQKEFRIIARTDDKSEAAHVMHIGSLRDIAFMATKENLKRDTFTLSVHEK